LLSKSVDVSRAPGPAAARVDQHTKSVVPHGGQHPPVSGNQLERGLQASPGLSEELVLLHGECRLGDDDPWNPQSSITTSSGINERARVRAAVGSKLVVVDDDEASARATGELLERAGYDVEIATAGQAALELVASRPPDMMLLDYEMPDMDAVEVLAALRAGGERVPFPVLIVTGARTAAADQVLALDRGAIDYIVKGVDRHVLIARVRAALRERTATAALRCGRLVVEPDRFRALLDERPLVLERRQFQVLVTLARRCGNPVLRTALLEEVWGTNYRGYDHALEQVVHALRKSLGDPRWVVTVRGVGYTLQPVEQ
jgi:two-component system response regulator MprA